MASDLIYARGISDNLSTDSNLIDKEYPLLVIEAGFCMKLGCNEKLRGKTEKYISLLDALQTHRREVKFICIPIGHAWTIMSTTQEDIATALAEPYPSSTTRRADITTPENFEDMTALRQKRKVNKVRLDRLCALVQSRTTTILAHRQQGIRTLDPNIPDRLPPTTRENQSARGRIDTQTNQTHHT